MIKLEVAFVWYSLIAAKLRGHDKCRTPRLWAVPRAAPAVGPVESGGYADDPRPGRDMCYVLTVIPRVCLNQCLRRQARN